jgi:phosphonate transport system substrate-binding protein
MFVHPEKAGPIALAVLILSLISISSAAEGKERYTLGVLPYLPAVQLETYWGIYANIIEKAISRPVDFKTRSTYELFSGELREESYEFAFVQPIDFALAVDRYNYRPIVKLSRELAILFVTQNSELTRLSDLKNRTLAFPPETAAISFMGLEMLARVKLTPGIDTRIAYRRSHHSCLQSVLINTADACATTHMPLRIFEQEHKVKLDVLLDSMSIPHLLFIAHERVPQRHFALVQQALLALVDTPAGLKILSNTGCSEGFAVVAKGDYDVVKKMMAGQ